jgi:hypothetical protein
LEAAMKNTFIPTLKRQPLYCVWIETVNSSSFQPYKKIGVVIDINSALQIDATLQIGQNTQTVEVNDSVVTIQMSDTEIGETINSQHVAEVPLNGRSYTDLLATQAGVSPVTTSGASNSSSGGGLGTVPVAGNENTGQFSTCFAG